MSPRPVGQSVNALPMTKEEADPFFPPVRTGAEKKALLIPNVKKVTKPEQVHANELLIDLVDTVIGELTSKEVTIVSHPTQLKAMGASVLGPTKLKVGDKMYVFKGSTKPNGKGFFHFSLQREGSKTMLSSGCYGPWIRWVAFQNPNQPVDIKSTGWLLGRRANELSKLMAKIIHNYQKYGNTSKSMENQDISKIVKLDF